MLHGLFLARKKNENYSCPVLIEPFVLFRTYLRCELHVSSGGGGNDVFSTQYQGQRILQQERKAQCIAGGVLFARPPAHLDLLCCLLLLVSQTGACFLFLSFCRCAAPCLAQQAPSVVVEDMAIAAASIRDGRPPDERLTLPLTEIHQNRADVSRSSLLATGGGGLCAYHALVENIAVGLLLLLLCFISSLFANNSSMRGLGSISSVGGVRRGVAHNRFWPRDAASA